MFQTSQRKNSANTLRVTALALTLAGGSFALFGCSSPKSEMADAINKSFGNFGDFKKTFSQAATTRFGSGWAWLLFRGGKLTVESTANQDNPIMDGGKAVFGLDVWEHAYYLKYQNRRPEYIEAWWNTVDWSQVADNFAQAKA